MKKFAVAYMNFFDNCLTVRVIESDNWVGALQKRLLEIYPDSEPIELSEDIEAEKTNAFDQEWVFDVTEV